MSSMSDRELLEMAAKAAGIEIVFEVGKPQRIDLFRGHLANYEDWDPLTDDGDALRLAVKMRLAIDITRYKVYASNGSVDGSTETTDTEDQYAATRRAIVRAAAAIGKEMP